LAWAIAVASLAGLAACGGHSGKPPAEAALNIYSWADYIGPDTLANFERETGITVRYTTFDTTEVLEAKLQAGHTDYDIVFPSDYSFEGLAKAGVFRKLDKTALSNYGNLDPDLMAKVAVHDPGNLYGVPYVWFTTGLGYDVDKVRERLGPAEINSWSLLFDPKNAAKLKDCGIRIIDSPTEVISSVLIYLGKDPGSRDPADLNAAADALMQIRPFVRAVDSARLIGEFASGGLCLVLAWSGDAMLARYRGLQSSNGVKIRYFVPHEGGLIGTDMMSILADAPHPLNAQIWMNYVMRPEVMAGITNAVKYPNGNRASLRFVHDAIKNDPSIYPDAETRAKLHTLTPTPPELVPLMTRLWTRFRAGQ
jgi:putrescine transport system substrate-binding protein